MILEATTITKSTTCTFSLAEPWFAGTGLLPDGTGNNDAFTNNRCLLKVGGRYQSDCGHNAKGFITHDNTIYTKGPYALGCLKP